MGQTKTSFAFNSKLYDPRTGREISGAPIDGIVKPRSKNSRGGHLKRHAQKSKTLMRSGLKKPKSAIRTMGKSAAVHAPAIDLTRKVSKAKKIGKSELIQKFSPSLIDAKATKVDKRPRPRNMPAAHAQTVSGSLGHSSQSAKPDFNAALDQAKSHLQKPPKRTGRKIGLKSKGLSIALFTSVAVILAGFFAWQNTLQLQMRLAAARAGFPASLPGYNPAGFSASGGIATEPGKITLAYKSETNGKTFNIVQQASEWTNETLFLNYILPAGLPYQTYQESGKTVYLLDNTRATWVSGGVWYQIEGEAELTSDQLLRIAGSL